METSHRVYIIMQYAPNGSLLDLIRKKKYLTEELARIFFKQLMNVVEYCHKKGVAHRDIKCENIVFDEKFVLKLIDFGFAKHNTHLNRNLLTATYCGSHAYACPEILKEIPYNPQYADIWACGVVLYAMVYGRLPFNDSNLLVLLQQIQSRINFPKIPAVHVDCQNFISKIIAPYRNRILIHQIVEDVWMKNDLIVDVT